MKPWWTAIALLAAVCACKSNDPATPTTPATSVENGATPTAAKPGSQPSPSGSATAPTSSDAAVPARSQPPEPGTVRVVIVHAGELLGSEARAVAEMTRKLEKHGDKLSVVEAVPDESAAAKRYFEGDQVGELPKSWQSNETVIVLQVLPWRGSKPKRTSGGLGSALIVRPPSPEPIYLERAQTESGTMLRGAQLAERVTSMITIAQQPGGEQ